MFYFYQKKRKREKQDQEKPDWTEPSGVLHVNAVWHEVNGMKPKIVKVIIYEQRQLGLICV